MKYKIQDPAIRELTHQELENVSGGTSVVHVAVAVVHEVVNILSTGTIGAADHPKGGVNAGVAG